MMRVLRRAASGKVSGGESGVLIAAMGIDVESKKRRAELLQLLEPECAATLSATLQFWQDQIQEQARVGLSGSTDMAMELSKRGHEIHHQLRRGERSRASAEPTAVIPTTCAVGKIACKHPNTLYSHIILEEDGEAVPVYEPKKIKILVEGAANRLIPPRLYPYAPTNVQSLSQWKSAKSWKLGRILPLLEQGQWDAYFLIGDMSAAVQAWKAKGHTGCPPVATLMKVTHTTVIPCALCSPNGHIWSVRDVAPLDEAQLARILGSEDLQERLRKIVVYKTVTESQMRQLLGQATAQQSINLVMSRTLQRLGPRWSRNHGASIGLVGAGIGLTGVQVAIALKEVDQARII